MIGRFWGHHINRWSIRVQQHHSQVSVRRGIFYLLTVTSYRVKLPPMYRDHGVVSLDSFWPTGSRGALRSHRASSVVLKKIWTVVDGGSPRPKKVTQIFDYYQLFEEPWKHRSWEFVSSSTYLAFDLFDNWGRVANLCQKGRHWWKQDKAR